MHPGVMNRPLRTSPVPHCPTHSLNGCIPRVCQCCTGPPGLRLRNFANPEASWNHRLLCARHDILAREEHKAHYNKEQGYQKERSVLTPDTKVGKNVSRRRGTCA